MEFPQVKTNSDLVHDECSEEEPNKSFCEPNASSPLAKASKEVLIALEAEIPEVLYKEMDSFIDLNPQWNKYELMSAALANFLFQNGSQDRAVTERYLNDLFTLADS